MKPADQELVGQTLLRPLMLEKCNKEIKALCARAFEQTIPLDEMKRRADAWNNGDTTVEARDPNFTIEIPIGWKVTYTVEQHPPGLMRHLVVSIIDNKIQANIIGIALLAEKFNFVNPIERCLMYVDENQAVHVVDPFDGDTDAVLRAVGKPQ